MYRLYIRTSGSDWSIEGHPASLLLDIHISLAPPPVWITVSLSFFNTTTCPKLSGCRVFHYDSAVPKLLLVFIMNTGLWVSRVHAL